MESGLWRKLLGQYGQKVSLCRGEERVQVRAFFQPVREKAVGEEPTALGSIWAPQRRSWRTWIL